MQYSNKYTIVFTVAVCLVCSVAVSSLAVALKDRQQSNVKLERQVNILRVAELVEPGENPNAAEAGELFKQIETIIVDRVTGEIVNDFPNPQAYDSIKAAKDLNLSKTAPPNRSQISRLPDKLVVYEVSAAGKESYIIPVYGAGLWSTMYGFLAFEKDCNTIKGLTFYQHGETPGLGGEIDNKAWQALWRGKKAYKGGQPAIKVVKGSGSGEYEVDGLSGATLTAKGVTHMMHFWLQDVGYGKFLQVRSQGGANG